MHDAGAGRVGRPSCGRERRRETRVAHGHRTPVGAASQRGAVGLGARRGAVGHVLSPFCVLGSGQCAVGPQETNKAVCALRGWGLQALLKSTHRDRP